MKLLFVIMLFPFFGYAQKANTALDSLSFLLGKHFMYPFEWSTQEKSFAGTLLLHIGKKNAVISHSIDPKSSLMEDAIERTMKSIQKTNKTLPAGKYVIPLLVIMVGTKDEAKAHHDLIDALDRGKLGKDIPGWTLRP